MLPGVRVGESDFERILGQPRAMIWFRPVPVDSGLCEWRPQGASCTLSFAEELVNKRGVILPGG
jgi:hypothetical protein